MNQNPALFLLNLFHLRSLPSKSIDFHLSKLRFDGIAL
jgi:hypothetical protein